MRDARPNAVHHAIVDLHRAGKLLAVVTQNIDGLHQMAGLPEERVIELHGTNRWIECLACKRRFEPQPLFDEFSSTLRPPRCPECAGWLKPATISFGQSLDPKTLEAAERAVKECDAVIALGSTLSGLSSRRISSDGGKARRSLRDHQSRSDRTRRSSGGHGTLRRRCRRDLPEGRRAVADRPDR